MSASAAGPWHARRADDVAASLGTSLMNGLRAADVHRLQREYGPNQLTAYQSASSLRLLIDQFRSIVVLLLAAAVVVAIMSADYPEAIAIGVVLAINALLGWAVELRARRSMEALLGSGVTLARVRRDGVTTQLDAAQLVPGDIIELEAGDAVPADARLSAATEVHASEAQLTGESNPVSKNALWTGDATTPLPERRNCVFAGTHIVNGTAEAIVVATGNATEVGRIGELVRAVANTRTPLERRLDALGRRLVLLALAVTAVVLIVGLLRNIDVETVLQTSIALAVAAVPEALPAVATIGLAVGLRRMSRRKALIRKLHAVEALGSTTVVCTDKTGTLTANQMSVQTLQFIDARVDVTGGGYEPAGEFREHDGPVTAAVLPQLVAAVTVAQRSAHARIHMMDDRWQADGDPTDVALHVLAMKGIAVLGTMAAPADTSIHLPFSSLRQWSADFIRSGNDGFEAFVKGSPQRVLERCAAALTASGVHPLAAEYRARIEQANSTMASSGLRVIALACGRVADTTESALTDLTWVALAGLIDAPAEGVRETIEQLHAAGIRIVVITGDQQLTAAAVARQVGIAVESGEMLDAANLHALSGAALEERIAQAGLHSRSSPEDKFLIVRTLQARGEIVAMLGDGVNDAAALKQADISVAMGRRGSDIARSVADVVLQDDRFATIASAVEEGRAVYDNIRKFIFYLFSCNLAEVLVLLVAGTAGMAIPGAPLKILWLNLVTDTFPALALAFEPADADIMKRPPRHARAEIMSASFVRAAVFYGALIAVATCGAFVVARTLGYAEERAVTVGFMTLAMAQLSHLGNARSREPVLSFAQATANRIAIGAVALVIVLQVLVLYLPPIAALLETHALTPGEWLIVVVSGSLPGIVGQVLHSK